MSSYDFPPLKAGEYGILGSDIWPHRQTSGGVYGMVPMPGLSHSFPCTRCELLIEPLEPYHRSQDGATAWCDACMAEEESEL